MVSLNPVGLVALVLGVGLIGYAGWNGRHGYRIYMTDPVDVLELPDRDGYVEVEGHARPLEDEGTFQAPFSGSDCLACRYRIEEYKSSGEHASWETIDEGGGWLPFVLEGDTGQVRVDPAGAILKFDENAITVDASETPPDRVQQYIERNESLDAGSDTIDLKLVELNVGNDRKYVEERLEPREDVFVAGQSRYDAGWDRPSGFVNATLGHGDATPLFLIADTGERAAAWRTLKPALATGVIGSILLVFAAVLLA
jgi:hypothetical protein